MSKKEEYIKEILDVIKKKKIMRFSHCFAFVSFSSSTAYNHGLEKVESIKDALFKNRMSGMNYLLQKWISSDNPTLQIAAARLIAESDDHRRMNQQYIEQRNIQDKPIFNIKPEDDAEETDDTDK